MSRISKQVRNTILLLGIFAVSFTLYAGAESGSAAVMTILLGCLAALMAATTRFG